MINKNIFENKKYAFCILSLMSVSCLTGAYNLLDKHSAFWIEQTGLMLSFAATALIPWFISYLITMKFSKKLYSLMNINWTIITSFFLITNIFMKTEIYYPFEMIFDLFDYNIFADISDFFQGYNNFKEPKLIILLNMCLLIVFLILLVIIMSRISKKLLIKVTLKDIILTTLITYFLTVISSGFSYLALAIGAAG